MAKDPAFLFYYQDFAYGTRKMSFEEKGAYVELLCEQADTGHMSLDDIKRALNAHFSIWETIRVKFDVDNDGLFFNKVLDEHINNRKKYVKSRLSNLKGKKDASHMDSHMVNVNVNENVNKNNKVYVDLNVLIAQGVTDKVELINRLSTKYTEFVVLEALRKIEWHKEQKEGK